MEKYKEKAAGYRFFKFTLGWLFKLWYRPIVINKEVIPKDGPIIICGNHMHVMDQCPVILSTNRMVHYMAKKEYFDGKFAWFFKMSGCIPVNRQIKDNNATEAALEVLQNGKALGLFPEGTRNKTDKIILPFKFGAVSMAQKTGATIVPFATSGEYKRGKDLIVRFGKPFKVGKDEDLAEVNKKFEDQIISLLKKNKKELELIAKKRSKK